MEKQKDWCDSETRDLSQRDKVKKKKMRKLVKFTNLDTFL